MRSAQSCIRVCVPQDAPVSSLSPKTCRSGQLETLDTVGLLPNRGLQKAAVYRCLVFVKRTASVSKPVLYTLLVVERQTYWEKVASSSLQTAEISVLMRGSGHRALALSLNTSQKQTLWLCWTAPKCILVQKSVYAQLKLCLGKQ